jgi:disintegrin and metalloproteinase domain-containing protein 10
MAAGMPTSGADGNSFCQDNVDVANYLNVNSMSNHSAFCLAYAVTYRDFVFGTLGLAWASKRRA